MLLKPFVAGDNIIAQGIEGTVRSIQIFYTQVTTYDNRTVILPNSMLSNNMIINISREGMRRLDITYKFNNDTDVEQARNVIDDAIRKEAELLRKPEHRIGVTLLEQGNYTLAINVWVNAHGYEDTRLRLQEALLKNIRAAGLKQVSKSALALDYNLLAPFFLGAVVRVLFLLLFTYDLRPLKALNLDW